MSVLSSSKTVIIWDMGLDIMFRLDTMFKKNPDDISKGYVLLRAGWMNQTEREGSCIVHAGTPTAVHLNMSGQQ